MVGVTIPIAMPISRAPRENVIARTAAASEAVAVCDRTNAVFTIVPNCSKISRTIVLEPRETAATIERSGRKLALTDGCNAPA